jgi:ankyrin repeat protein
MFREITSRTTLENLKREAKRWLHALRDDDPDVRRDARARLERAIPNAAADVALRQVQFALAREYGFPGWAALKSHLASLPPSDDERASRVAWFIDNACPDHHVRGGPAHVRVWHTARRLLDRHPEIASDSFYTAIVCGDIDRVRRTLAERPEAANEKGGPKGWEPILYLCFSRAPVQDASENAVAIARALLDAGADPNVHFAAGGSAYTPLVGVVGEGEEDRPAHPQRDALVRRLLERGANPFDIQVIYNTGFHGEFLWFLEMIHEESVKRGREEVWKDPEWEMIGMGGYGTGARWVLDIAVRDDNLALAEWALSHGANPNAGPPRAKSMSQRSLYEEAVRAGRTEMADLLVRFGAVAAPVVVEGIDRFIGACLRLDTAEARAILEQHPEYLQATEPIFRAAQQDRADVVALLIELGTSPEIEDGEHQRPLHVAAYYDALHVAQLLLDRGVEADPVHTAWNNTPLGAATYSQHPRLVELLARVSRDIWELTNGGHIDRLREVLRAEPALARTVSGGHTPLMWLPPDDAVRAMEVATLLLQYGADPTLRNEDGETAADRALKLGLFEVAELLQQPGSPASVTEPS